jgi:hypothetical protein
VIIPTPLDPNQFQLQTVTAGPDTFSIDVPTDWKSEDIAAPAGFGKRYYLEQDGNRTAQVTVRCQYGATIDTMTSADAALVQGLKGQFNLSKATAVSVGALEGKQVDFALVFGGTLSEQRGVYVEAPPCGWRITLQTFGAGRREQYGALFDRLLATFHAMVPSGG